MKLLRDLFTEDDAGTTWCFVRLAGGFLVAVFTLAGVTAIIHGTINFQEFGIGGAGLLGGMGTGIGVKSRLGADLVKAAPPAKPKPADDGD